MVDCSFYKSTIKSSCLLYLYVTYTSEAVIKRCSVKKAVLEVSQNSQENACARVSFLKERLFLAQLFSCEVCEIFKNFFSYRTPPLAASGVSE